MTTYNEQEAVMQGIAERFAKAAEELRLSGAQLYREGIVTNDQVLSKIKNGWQKPTKKTIELFCQKYGVSAAWLYTGDNQSLLAMRHQCIFQWQEILISCASTPTSRLRQSLCLLT